MSTTSQSVKQAKVTVIFKDYFGNPIKKLQYEIRQGNKVMASGVTPESGLTKEFSVPKGSTLDAYVKYVVSNQMLFTDSFTVKHTYNGVTVYSPETLVDTQTVAHKGGQGNYRRKTHTVKPGETLTSIAQRNHTTVRALVRLNGLKDADHINAGAILKLPVDDLSHGAKPKKPATPPKDKKTESAQSPASSPKKPAPAKETSQGKDSGMFGSLEEVGQKALEITRAGAEMVVLGPLGYTLFKTDVGKKIIETVTDRSAATGTPKTDVASSCKTNPACITKENCTRKEAKELIREINIRLAGFGGALPADEFTDLTEACIKQFQRDYMGMKEPTGKVCGGLLKALDEFAAAYPIDQYFEQMKCPCGKCEGFGKGRSGSFNYINKKGEKATFTCTEPPGMHRSLIWAIKSMMFYFACMSNPKGYKISGFSSGYRCVDRNIQKTSWDN